MVTRLKWETTIQHLKVRIDLVIIAIRNAI